MNRQVLAVVGLFVSVFLSISAQAERGLSDGMPPQDNPVTAMWPFEPDWTVYENVEYGPSPEEIADLYLLKGKNNPVVIFIHGGGWSAGDKSGYKGYYAEKYAWAGLSVISINYRLAKTEDPKTHWPAQLQDVQLAVRWAREYADNLGIDPNRICAFGDSAGGHLATFLGVLQKSRAGDRSKLFAAQSPTVACVVNMFGPADFTRPEFRKVFKNPPLFGGKSYSQAPQLYADASPIRSVNAQTAPTMMIQGLKDQIVVPSLARQLVQRLNTFKVPNEYVEFNGGHWFEDAEPPQVKTAVDDKALQFVARILHPRDF